MGAVSLKMPKWAKVSSWDENSSLDLRMLVVERGQFYLDHAAGSLARRS